MNSNQNILLNLIGQSQFGIDYVNLAENANWEEILDEAVAQAIQGIIAPEIPSDAENTEKWKQIELRQLAAYVKYCYAEDEVNTSFNREEIPFVILKGHASAKYYNVPSRRVMGDIDVLVPQTYFNQAKSLLLKNEYVEMPGSEKHARHNEFQKYGVVVELHRNFSHDDVDIEDYIVSGMNSIQVGRVENHEFPMLPRLPNGLVLLAHMREHLKGGLGLRQVVDWMMYVYRELDDEFWEKEFSRVAKEKKMDTLAIVATRMCQIYMGLPEKITWCKDADEELCEQLMENLLSSGNFGRKQGSGNSVEFVSTHMKSQGMFRWLQKMGEYNWEAYRKHHWLKPFCWIYQGIRYMKKGFKTGRNRKQLSDDLNRSEQRYELLKKLGIE